MDLTIPTATHTSLAEQRRRPRLVDGHAMDQQQQPRQRRSRKRERPPPPPGRSGQQEEEAREEDVDRFFALLADVREMRELWRRNGGGEAAAQRTTRVDDRPSQDQRQLWRPTFVMEDFAFELKGSEVQAEKKKVDDAPNLDLSLSM
ncbi:NRR repressor homolog 3-like [Oryza brachyantha]|uniref:Uncharacterized protein n=1 Tax=Oryza brachyantha TaxID=4533 RepID=J3L0D1_ORYBR|nr:NRR repressor homolog 3-like [Oryza brachyantha]